MDEVQSSFTPLTCRLPMAERRIIATRDKHVGDMQTMTWKFLVLAALGALAACATPPSAIEAKTVDDGRFADLDCPALLTERDRKIQIRDLLSDAQNERFRADLISGALTGMTQSMINSPSEREAKIAEVKGEIVALNQELAVKHCVLRLTD